MECPVEEPRLRENPESVVERVFFVFIFPITIHVSYFVGFGAGSIADRIQSFSSALLLLTWGGLGLISIAVFAVGQVLTAFALAKSDLGRTQIFFIGLLNPAVAIIGLTVLGMFLA